MAARGSGRRRGSSPRSSRGSLDATGVRTLLRTIRQESKDLTEEMTFGEYLKMVQEDPAPARLAHARIHDSIVAAGVSTGADGRDTYDLFQDELFGFEDVIRQIVEYFSAAGNRLDVRKRILVLAGPPGSGKSTLVNAVKAGLEAYTRTPQGAVYTVRGCPVQEEPLHLIPPHLRDQIKGIHVEGDLCPFCRWLVREIYQGDVERVPIERIVFSTAEGVGISTFLASDPGSQDITRLVGRVDPALLPADADEDDAHRAFRLDGELTKANRGLADLIEIFKMDERFLASLLTVSQEQMIKFAGPMTMYADEAIVGHTNLAEYGELIENPHAAALQDRLVVVHVGYVLSVLDEVRIYERLLGEADLSDAHISPLALPAAATLAVLTRLREPRRAGWDLRKKLQLYDRRYVPDAGASDREDFRREAPDEGSFGISPRYVINQLSYVMNQGQDCISGLDFLELLWAGMPQRASFREEGREEMSDLFETARDEYDEMVRRTIRRSMVARFDEMASTRARDALRDLRRWRTSEESDLPKVRELERKLGVSFFRRKEFRQSLYQRLEAGAERYGEDDLHLEDPRLEEAIERALLPAWGEAARVLRGDSSQAKQQRRRVRERLMEVEGFSELCADELLDYASRLAAPRRERGEEEQGWER